MGDQDAVLGTAGCGVSLPKIQPHDYNRNKTLTVYVTSLTLLLVADFLVLIRKEYELLVDQ